MSHFHTIITLLLGVPYKCCDPSVSCVGDQGPFWAVNGPLPSREEIEKGGMNCAGFLNLVCRGLGQPIPGLVKADFYAGGTHAWYVYLQQKGVLRAFGSWHIYPQGTLLLRRYVSEEDQGHLAIYMGPNSIVHSWPEKGSCFDTIQSEYYEFICLPEDWMS
jgi:hypothetical protein